MIGVAATASISIVKTLSSAIVEVDATKLDLVFVVVILALVEVILEASSLTSIVVVPLPAVLAQN